MGREVKDVCSTEEALSSVHSLTVLNDVSARKWQGKKGGGQWSRSKGFDTFLPAGPCLVHPLDPGIAPASGGSSAGGSGGRNGGGGGLSDDLALEIKTTVNGEEMQSSTTDDMIFKISELIIFLSQGTTLLPGTVLATGTPEGVGYTRKPPHCLIAGDEVVVSCQGIGSVRNRVVLGR